MALPVLWGGAGAGGSLLRLRTCNERGHYLSLPSPPVASSFHTSTESWHLLLITSWSTVEVLDSFREVARQFFTVFCLCFMVSLQKDLLTVRVRLKLEVF